MITIKNLKNIPLMVDGKSLGAHDRMKVRSITDEAQRLADKNFVSIIQPKVEKSDPPKQDPPKVDPPKNDPPKNDPPKGKENK
jgi:hypothetical protein